MKPHFKIFSAFVLLLSAACTPSDELAVRNKGLEIRWEQTAEGWKISRIADRKGRCWGVPDGAYTILFSSEKPSAEPETITNRGGDTMNFDIARFHYIAKDFNRAVSSVPMNRAGEALRFSHENPDVQALYRDYLGKPLGEKSHHLLHTDHLAWEMPQAQRGQ